MSQKFFSLFKVNSNLEISYLPNTNIIDTKNEIFAKSFTFLSLLNLKLPYSKITTLLR